ncbi:DUF2845 domain-containing protein [Pseudomonas sp. NPDC007930]|uniref:DUF2845 domain-containing protein n=1 Tax=Pseudomonas sp. NPDC007930 TaxID=3364417 RepID=UPI0036EFB4CC
MRCATLAMAAVMLLGSTAASATMRCGTHLINNGDALDEVLGVCGAPAKHTTEQPTLNRQNRQQAQKTDVVVYGPNGGAYQYLLFVNDALVRVDLRRDAP